jgi:hypothetical protein
VSQDINSGGNHGFHTNSVLRMGEHRLALGMCHIDRGLGDGRIHVHHRPGAHVRTGKELYAVKANSEIVARDWRGFVRRGSFGEGTSAGI